MTSLTIGELSERTGEAPHVLRHWENVGLLHPARTARGRRQYTEADAGAVRVIRRLQRVGFSLAELHALQIGTRNGRRVQVDHHRQRLQQDRAAIDAAIGYLSHILHCTHAVVDECRDCAAFARGSGSPLQQGND